MYTLGQGGRCQGGGGSKRLTLRNGGQTSPSRDLTVLLGSIRCVYRAELILGRKFTYRIGLNKPKDPCHTKNSTISIHESEIKVH